MTEDKPANPPSNGGTGGEPPKTVTMTQEQLNKLIGDTRIETRTQADKEIAKLKADHDEQIKIAAMKEQDRIKAEADLANKKRDEELASYKNALAMKNAEAELAKVGLDVSFADMVVDADEKKTAENIAKLKKQVDGDVGKILDEKAKKGAPTGGKAGAGGSDMKDMLRNAAGLPAKK